jgi:Animal haem peroxidase
MHGLNLSMFPEVLNGNSVQSQNPIVRGGKVPIVPGRQNILELDDASVFGAHKDPMELRKLMRKLSARIGRERFCPDEINTNIPSGYTYLLQFIAHDMVNTSISLAATSGRRFGFQNARQLPLTLETIYGGGPDVSPQAYEYTHKCSQLHGLMPRTRLRAGHAQNPSGSTKGMPFADVGRAVPVGVEDDGIRPGDMLRTEALVADARNEDQALIAQITRLFHQLHNFILGQIEAARPSDSVPLAYGNFICARYLLTFIYRRIVLQDVLRRLLDPSAKRYYLNEKKPLVTRDENSAIPVEFSNGAFRCGHAMVREKYRVNSNQELEAGRALQICSRRSPGFVPLPKEWIVNWDYFFEINTAEVTPNYSRPLCPNFSPIARSEYFFAPLIPREGDDGDAAGLPNRDLVSAVYARMWSVPKLIDALRAKSADIAAFLPPYSASIQPLTTWLEQTADPNGISEQFGPGDVSEIAKDPPLPFYILHEASVCNEGKRLGPLGSIIVAETIIGAMEKFPLTVETMTFDPSQDFKSQIDPLGRLGIKKSALSQIPEIETFDELLQFMQSAGLLSYRR